MHAEHFLIFNLFILERGREGERAGEKYGSAASHIPPGGDLACNREYALTVHRNRQPFVLKDDVQSSQPHQWEHELLVNWISLSSPQKVLASQASTCKKKNLFFLKSLSKIYFISYISFHSPALSRNFWILISSSSIYIIWAFEQYTI